MVPGYLQLVTTCYLQIYLEVWSPVANSPKPSKLQRKCTMRRVMKRSGYGNALNYDLSMFVEFENFQYLPVNSYMTQLQSNFTILPNCLFETY